MQQKSIPNSEYFVSFGYPGYLKHHYNLGYPEGLEDLGYIG